MNDLRMQKNMRQKKIPIGPGVMEWLLKLFSPLVKNWSICNLFHTGPVNNHSKLNRSDPVTWAMTNLLTLRFSNTLTGLKMSFSFNHVLLIRRQLPCLKSDSHLPKNVFIICFNESPSNIMKNAFYFILKLFLFSRYFSFCLDFLEMQRKRLDQKYKINFKIYDVYKMLNISRIIGNQTIKYGHLVEYPKRKTSQPG